MRQWTGTSPYRDAGFVGSVCSSGMFEPTVANAFNVDNASTVAGAATNAVTVVKGSEPESFYVIQRGAALEQVAATLGIGPKKKRG